MLSSDLLFQESNVDHAVLKILSSGQSRNEKILPLYTRTQAHANVCKKWTKAYPFDDDSTRKLGSKIGTQPMKTNKMTSSKI